MEGYNTFEKVPKRLNARRKKLNLLRNRKRIVLDSTNSLSRGIKQWSCFLSKSKIKKALTLEFSSFTIIVRKLKSKQRW